MTRRILVSQLALTMLLFAFVSADAQEEKTKAPVNKYGLTLKYRKFDQEEFDAKQKYALECFQEEETGNGIYVAQTGALSVVPKGLFKGGDGKDKGPLSQHGFSVSVRPSDSKAKTPKYGVECFLDENNSNLIYVTETGSISVIPSKHATPTKGKIKGYSRTHGMDLRVRKAGDKDWDKPTTKTYGIDVYDDDNNSNVIYLSETGSVCVLPSATAGKSAGEKKKPDWQYGLDLKVRGATEKQISKDSKAFGIEVFKDTNNGSMIYVVENGNIAVVPSKLAKFIGEKEKSKDPDLKRGFNLGVRSLTEDKFTDKTKKTSVEVYLDENNNNLIYISENGQIAVVPGKEE
jgi:hypothetical protein